MNKISSISTPEKNNEWKKALDGTDDSYWTAKTGISIEIKIIEECKRISFDFQKGFQPKKFELNNKIYSMTRNESKFEVALEKLENNTILLNFIESHDPYGRIYVYNIRGE